MSFLQKIMGKNSKKEKSKGGKKMVPEKGLKGAAALVSSLAVPSVVSTTPQVGAQPSPPPQAQASVAAPAPTTTPSLPSPKLKGKKSRAQASGSTSQIDDNMSSQSPKEPNRALASALFQDGHIVDHEVKNQEIILLSPPANTLTQTPEKRSSFTKSEETPSIEISTSETSFNSDREKGVKCDIDLSQKSKEVPVETKNKPGRIPKPTQKFKASEQSKAEKPKDVQVAEIPKALLITESREPPKESMNATQTAASIRLDTKKMEITHVTKSSTHVSSWLHDKLVLESKIVAMSSEAALSTAPPRETLKTQAGGNNAQHNSSREVDIEHKEPWSVSPRDGILPHDSGSCYGITKEETPVETAKYRNSSSLDPVMIQKKKEESETLDQSSPGSAAASKRVSDTLWTILENFEQQIHQDKTSQNMLVPTSKQRENAEGEHKTRSKHTGNMDPVLAPATTTQVTPVVNEAWAIKTEKQLQELLGTGAITEYEDPNKPYQVSVGPTFEANTLDAHGDSKNKDNQTKLMDMGKATPLYIDQTTIPSNSVNAQEKASSFGENGHKTLNDDQKPEVAIATVEPQQEYEHINLLQAPKDPIIQSRELDDEQKVILQEPKFAVVFHSQHVLLHKEQKLKDPRESLEEEPQKETDERPVKKLIKQASLAQESMSEKNTIVANLTQDEGLTSEQRGMGNDIDENKHCRLEKEPKKVILTETTADMTKNKNLVSQEQVNPNDTVGTTCESPCTLQKTQEDIIPTEETLYATPKNITQEQIHILELKDELQPDLPINVFPPKDYKFLEVGLQQPEKVTMFLSPDKDKHEAQCALTGASTIPEEKHNLTLDGESLYTEALVEIDESTDLKEVYLAVEFQQVQGQASTQVLKQEELLHMSLLSEQDSLHDSQNPEIKHMSIEEGLQGGRQKRPEKPSSIKKRPPQDHNHEDNNTAPASPELKVHEEQVSHISSCEKSTTLCPDQIIQKEEWDSQAPPHSAMQDSMSIMVDDNMAKDVLEPHGVVDIPQHQLDQTPQQGIMDALIQEGVNQQPQAADLEPTPWVSSLHCQQGQEHIHKQQTSHTANGQSLQLNNNETEIVTDGWRNVQLPKTQSDRANDRQEIMLPDLAANVDGDHQCAHKELQDKFASLDAAKREYNIQDAHGREPLVKHTSQEIQLGELAQLLMQQASVPQDDEKNTKQAEENSLEEESTQDPKHRNLQDAACEQEQSFILIDEDPVDTNFHMTDQDIKPRQEDIRLDQESNQITLPDSNMEAIADKLADTSGDLGVLKHMDGSTEVEATLKQEESVNEIQPPELHMFSDFDKLCTKPIQVDSTQVAITTSAVSTSIDVAVRENQDYPKGSTETLDKVIRDMGRQKFEKAILSMQMDQLDEMQGPKIAHASQDTEQEAPDAKHYILCVQNRTPSSENKQLYFDEGQPVLEPDRSGHIEIAPVDTGENKEVQPWIELLAGESLSSQLTKPEVIATHDENKFSTEEVITERKHASLYIAEDALQKPEISRVVLDRKQKFHRHEFRQDHADSIIQKPAITSVPGRLGNDWELEVANITQDQNETRQDTEATFSLEGVHNEEVVDIEETENQQDPNVQIEQGIKLINSMDKQEQKIKDLREIATQRTNQVQLVYQHTKQPANDEDIMHSIDQCKTESTTVHTDTSSIIGEKQACLDVNQGKSKEQKPQMADAETEEELKCESIDLTQAPEKVDIREEISFKTDDQSKALCELGVAEVQIGVVNENKPQEQELQMTDAAIDQKPKSDNIQIMQASQDLDISVKALTNICEQWEAIPEPGVADNNTEEVSECKSEEKELQITNVAAVRKDIDIRDALSCRTDEQREAICEPQIAEVQIEDVIRDKPKEKALHVTSTALKKDPTHERTEITHAPEDITIRKEASFETDNPRKAICEPVIDEVQTGSVNEYETYQQELQITDAAAENKPTMDWIEITQAPKATGSREEVLFGITKQKEALCEPDIALFQKEDAKEYNSEEQALHLADATVEKEATSNKIEIIQAPKDTDIKKVVIFKADQQSEANCDPEVVQVQVGGLEEYKSEEQAPDAEVEKEATSNRLANTPALEDTNMKEEVIFKADEQREVVREPDIAGVQIGDVSMNQLQVGMDRSQQPEEPRAAQRPDDALDCEQNVSVINNEPLAQTNRQKVGTDKLHETDGQDEPYARLVEEDQKTNTHEPNRQESGSPVEEDACENKDHSHPNIHQSQNVNDEPMLTEQKQECSQFIGFDNQEHALGIDKQTRDRKQLEDEGQTFDIISKSNENRQKSEVHEDKTNWEKPTYDLEQIENNRPPTQPSQDEESKIGEPKTNAAEIIMVTESSPLLTAISLKLENITPEMEKDLEIEEQPSPDAEDYTDELKKIEVISETDEEKKNPVVKKQASVDAVDQKNNAQEVKDTQTSFHPVTEGQELNVRCVSIQEQSATQGSNESVSAELRTKEPDFAQILTPPAEQIQKSSTLNAYAEEIDEEVENYEGENVGQEQVTSIGSNNPQNIEQFNKQVATDKTDDAANECSDVWNLNMADVSSHSEHDGATNLPKQGKCEESKLREQCNEEPWCDRNTLPSTDKKQVSGNESEEVQQTDDQVQEPDVEVQPTDAHIKNSQTSDEDKQKNADHDMEAGSVCNSSLLIEESDDEKHAQALVCTEETQTFQPVEECYDQVQEPERINEAAMQSKTLDEHEETETEQGNSLQHPQNEQNSCAVNKEFHSIEKKNEEMQASAQENASKDERQCEILAIEHEEELANKVCGILSHDDVSIDMIEKPAEKIVHIKAQNAATDIEECQDEAIKMNQTHENVDNMQEFPGKDPNQANNAPIIDEQATKNIEQASYMQNVSLQQQEKLQKIDQKTLVKQKDNQQNAVQESMQKQTIDAVEINAPRENPLKLDDEETECEEPMGHEMDKQQDAMEELESNKNQTETSHESIVPADHISHDLDTAPTKADDSAQTGATIAAEDMHTCNPLLQETSCEILIVPDNGAPLEAASCAQKAHTPQEVEISNLIIEQKQSSGTDRFSMETSLQEQKLKAANESVNAEMEKGEKQGHQIATGLLRTQQEVQGREQVDVNEHEAEVQQLEVSSGQIESITDFSQIQDKLTFDTLKNEAERGGILTEAIIPPEFSNKDGDIPQEPDDKKEAMEQIQERDQVQSEEVFTIDQQATTLNKERDGPQECELKGASFDEVFRVDKQVRTLDKESNGTQESKITGASLEADKEGFKDASQKPNAKEEAGEQNQENEALRTEVGYQVLTLKEGTDNIQESKIEGAPPEADIDGFKDVTQEPNDKEETEQNQLKGEEPSDEAITEPKVEEQVPTLDEEKDGTQECEITKAPVEADKDESKDATQEPHGKEDVVEQNHQRDKQPSDEVSTEPNVEVQALTLINETNGKEESEIIRAPLEADKDRLEDGAQEPHKKEEAAQQNLERDKIPSDKVSTESQVDDQVTTLNKERDDMQESRLRGVPFDEIITVDRKVTTLNEERDDTQESKITGASIETDKQGFEDATQKPNDKEEAAEQNQGGNEMSSAEVEDQVFPIESERENTQENEIKGAPLKADKAGFKDATQELNDREEAAEQIQERNETPSDKTFTEPQIKEQVPTLNEERDRGQECETTGAPLEAQEDGFKDTNAQEPHDKEEAIEQRQERNRVPSDKASTEPKMEVQTQNLNEETNSTEECEITEAPVESKADVIKDDAQEPCDKEEAPQQNEKRDKLPSSQVSTEPKVEEQVQNLNKERDGTQECEIAGASHEADKYGFRNAMRHDNKEAMEENQEGDEVLSDQICVEPKVEEQVTPLKEEKDGTQESEITRAPFEGDRDGFKDATHEPNDKEEATEQNQGSNEVPSGEIFTKSKVEGQVMTANEQKDATEETERTGGKEVNVNKQEERVKHTQVSPDEAECTTKDEATPDTLINEAERDKVLIQAIIPPEEEHLSFNIGRLKGAKEVSTDNREGTQQNQERDQLPSDEIFTAPKSEDQVTILYKKRDNTEETEKTRAPFEAGKDSQEQNLSAAEVEDTNETGKMRETCTNPSELSDNKGEGEKSISTEYTDMSRQLVRDDDFKNKEVALRAVDNTIEADEKNIQEETTEALAAPKTVKQTLLQVIRGIEVINVPIAAERSAKIESQLKAHPSESESDRPMTTDEDCLSKDAENSSPANSIKVQTVAAGEPECATSSTKQLECEIGEPQAKGDPLEQESDCQCEQVHIGLLHAGKTSNGAGKHQIDIEELEMAKTSLNAEMQMEFANIALEKTSDTIKVEATESDEEAIEGDDAEECDRQGKITSNEVKLKRDGIINKDETEECKGVEEILKLEATNSLGVNEDRDDTEKRDCKEEFERPHKTIQVQPTDSIGVDKINRNGSEELQGEGETQKLEAIISIEIDKEKDDTEEPAKTEDLEGTEATCSSQAKIEQDDTERRDGTEQLQGVEEALRINLIVVCIEKDNTEKLERPEKTLQLGTTNSLEADLEKDDSKKSDGIEKLKEAEKTFQLETTESTELNIERESTKQSIGMDEVEGQKQTLQLEAPDLIDVDINRDYREEKDHAEEFKEAEETLILDTCDSIKEDIERDEVQDLRRADQETEQKSPTLRDRQDHLIHASEQNIKLHQIDGVSVPLDGMTTTLQHEVTDGSLEGFGQSDKYEKSNTSAQSDEVQKLSLTNIVPTELQKQESGLVDEGKEHEDVRSAEFDTKTTFSVDGPEAPLDIKQYNNDTEEWQNCVDLVVQQQESTVKDEEKDGVQKLLLITNEHLDSRASLKDKVAVNKEQPYTDAQEEELEVEVLGIKAELQMSCTKPVEDRVTCENMDQALDVNQNMQLNEQTSPNCDKDFEDRRDRYENASNGLLCDIALTKDDKAQNMQVMQEALGEPNQKVLEDMDDDESQTVTGIHIPTGEQKDKVQTLNEPVKDKPQQSRATKSQKSTALSLDGIDTRVTSNLLLVELQKSTAATEAESKIQILKERIALTEETPKLEEPAMRSLEGLVIDNGRSRVVHQKKQMQDLEVSDVGPNEQNVVPAATEVDNIAMEPPSSTYKEKEKNGVEELTVHITQPDNSSDNSHLDESMYHSPDQTAREADVKIPEDVQKNASKDPAPLDIIKDDAGLQLHITTMELQKESFERALTQQFADSAMFTDRQKDEVDVTKQDLEGKPGDSPKNKEHSTNDSH